MRLTIELPPREEQLAFNQRRWAEFCSDPRLQRLDGKFETDHSGNLYYMPPPSVDHNDYVNEIFVLLLKLLGGKPRTECPVNTVAGVKVPDVVWFSVGRHAKSKGMPAHSVAPEICVDVCSPGNTERQLDEKRDWYFDAGAEEVWRCDSGGRMAFFLKEAPSGDAGKSKLCPEFPAIVKR